MDPLLVLIAITFAGATTLSVLYTQQWLAAPQRVARRRIAPSPGGTLSLRSPLLNNRRARLPFVESLPLSAEARSRMDAELARADVPLRVSEYLLLRVVVACVAAGAAVMFMSSFGSPSWSRFAVSFAAFVAGWQLPRLWVGHKRRTRLDAIEAQLPGALTALAKSLRAGTGIMQAIDFASTQVEAPLGPELAQTLRQIRLGANPEEAFSSLSERVGSADLDIAVTAIVIQRNVGGNLSEILSNVSRTITQREKLHREIKVLTSRQKLTGNLVAAMPVLVALLFLGLNPKLADLLFGSTAGQIALAVGIAFELAGLFLIRRLARIEV